MSSFKYENFRDHQLQRDRLMHAAEQQKIAMIAQQRVKTRTRRIGLSIAVVIISIVIALTTAKPSFAQDLADAGGGEPYHPALVHYRVGYYFQLQGDHLRAIAEFDQVVAGLPEWGEGYAARGDSYAAIGEYALAIADYDVAISIYPDLLSALYMRGRAHHALGALELAHADYQNAIRQYADYAAPHWGLGDLYYAQGDTAAALAEYQLYIEYTASDATQPDGAVLARVAALEGVVVETSPVSVVASS